MSARKAARLALGIAFGALFLWLVLRHLGPGDLRRAFAGARAGWVAAAVLAFFAGYACRIARWRLMLARDTPGLTWRDCAGPFLASFAANKVLPFRAGDVLRSFAFNRLLRTSSGVVIATLLVERLLDLLMVLVLLGAALALFGLDAARFAGVGLAAIAAGAGAILFVLLFPRAFMPVALGAARLVARLAPGPGRKLLAEAERSFATLEHVARGNTMVKLVSWSLVAWLAEACVFWFAALALPSLLAPVAGWLALPVGTLATLIPSTPGYVGTFDYFTVRAMTALGNPSGAATAYALLVHALLWLPPTLVGGAYLLLRPVPRPDRSKEVPT
ncbi:MAG TPA: lysylphosphatidylglycerol synthase transmembrane domain-containing protein [Anaeromyxobacteraceae bacterium]|nr:lysylphosphatidylglycerol synthase transmembrane domain-containing protein [Anaeromyxobacteraceae bacterium]